MHMVPCPNTPTPVKVSAPMATPQPPAHPAAAISPTSARISGACRSTRSSSGLPGRWPTCGAISTTCRTSKAKMNARGG